MKSAPSSMEFGLGRRSASKLTLALTPALSPRERESVTARLVTSHGLVAGAASLRRSKISLHALNHERLHTRGFTMLELMIVVAIMGIIFAMATPSIRSAFHREAFTQGMHDILDACDFARKESIIHSSVMEMRIYPQTGHIEVSAVPRDVHYDDAASAPPPSGADAPTPVVHSYSADLSDRIEIQMLTSNFAEYKDAELARIRFYPNGTCTQFYMVIHSLDSGDYRAISLEEVTALADAGPFP